jgi:DNA-binding response OmpR family regulator
MENADRVCTRAELCDAMGGKKGDNHLREAHNLDSRIGRLRRALNEDNQRNIIRTVRSVGYGLGAEEEWPTRPGLYVRQPSTATESNGRG